MMITCCNGCSPQKRHGGCHATCPEYTQQKAEHEAEREQINKVKRTNADLNGPFADAVCKMNRRKKM